MRTLTVALVLVVIRHKGRSAAHAVAVRTNTCAVGGVLARATDNAVARRGPRAGLAERRTRYTGSPIAEATVRAYGPRARRRLRRNAGRLVVGVLSETSLAREALSVAIGTRGAPQAAY